MIMINKKYTSLIIINKCFTPQDPPTSKRVTIYSCNLIMVVVQLI